MLSMIQSDVVSNHHWLTAGQFTDIVAVSQMTPGPIGINSATYVGYTAVANAGYPVWAGVLGSFLATFSVILPSFILMIIISRFLMRFKNHPVVEDVFTGLRPAVVGLLAAAALLLCTADNFSSPDVDAWQFWISIALFAFTFIGQRTYKMNPILLILMCGAAGFLLL